MKELDVQLGDINKEINDMEGNIMNALEKTILSYEESLIDISNLVAELDCLLSLAFCAREFDLIRPIISTHGIINIEKGRHIIQEMSSTQIVPNDTFACSLESKTVLNKGNDCTIKTSTDTLPDIQRDQSPNRERAKKASKIKLLTGAHGSGKSIYIKQVGIIVFMAHIGSYVPASFAEIGPIDQIFTRIYSYDSVSSNYSMFMMDIARVSQAINYGTEKSLVLLDEIGKGTIPEDGLALLTGIINYYCEEPNRPFLFIITHFLELRHMLSYKERIDFQTMEIIKDMNKREIVYLYHLKEGFADNNHLKLLSTSLKFPEKIIDRAIEISQCEDNTQIGPQNLEVVNNIVQGLEHLNEYLASVNIEEDNNNIIKQLTNILANIFK